MRLAIAKGAPGRMAARTLSRKLIVRWWLALLVLSVACGGCRRPSANSASADPHAAPAIATEADATQEHVLLAFFTESRGFSVSISGSLRAEVDATRPGRRGSAFDEMGDENYAGLTNTPLF